MHFYPLWRHISKMTLGTAEIYIGHADYSDLMKLIKQYLTEQRRKSLNVVQRGRCSKN
jgi:hypothetical protein